MKILIIGSGGREHAIIWKLSQSPKVTKLFCAPGNAGISDMADCIPIKADDIKKIKEFALKEKIDFVVIGPEDPLAKGIVDELEKAGLKVFGASKKAAQLEASKSFAKKIMNKYGIPTAKAKTFTSFESAKKYVANHTLPIVIKADGLAAGKGVLICKTKKEAESALKKILIDKVFKSAGTKVLIEECLQGEEASFIAFTDGKTVLPLPSSQDHKRVFDDDKGPNTGGMGAYSPAPILTDSLTEKVMQEIMIPTVQGMAKEGIIFKGILYAGLMIDGDDIKVLEFNVRFGDPEAQPLFMRLKSDLLPIMMATIDGTLHKHKIEIDKKASVCVVMASNGYPDKYKKGTPIYGLEKLKNSKKTVVFHAGTEKKNKKIVTNGGRVLGVTSLGNTIEEAIKNVYNDVAKIDWDKVQYRKDIGKKAISKLKKKIEVSIIMGSKSDMKIMQKTADKLENFNIKSEIIIASAHRNPKKVIDFAKNASKRGIKVIIAGAGYAAHLAGVIAAHTTLPVIGVPIDSSSLNGLDSLLAMVQMPSSVPVATVTIGSAGASNSAILAAQIIALSDEEVSKKLTQFKKGLELS